jgi:hypothetical protein
MRAIQNAVAKALIADVTLKNLPKTMQELTSRQTMIAQAVARSNGWRHEVVASMVRAQWSKTHGRIRFETEWQRKR